MTIAVFLNFLQLLWWLISAAKDALVSLQAWRLADQETETEEN